MASGEVPAGGCDLDPAVFNLASAWFDRRPGEGRWKASHHGAGSVVVMAACGCPVCTRRLEQLSPRPPAPPTPEPEQPPVTVEVAPVREWVVGLLGAGWSRQRIAEAAGIDCTTVTRLLRGDVRRVRVETAESLLALSRVPGNGHPAVS